MAEPMDNLVVVTSVQFVALNLACPHCGKPVALLGRLALMEDRRTGGPCCVCEACGEAAYLVLRSEDELGGDAPVPR